MSASTNDIFKTIILEIRPRLQSVNAFVSLAESHEYIEVILDKDTIRIVTEKGAGDIACGDISIVQNSLLGVKVTGTFLTFRFATNNSLEKVGGFKTELLQNTVASMKSLSNKPLLSKNIGYTIQCSNCGKNLSDTIKFDRILPLPSESADASEWFCHSHQTNGISLDPNEMDIFYTHCFVHLNVNTLKNVKYSGTLAVCKFCLLWLGVRQNSLTVRLWFNTVKFLNSNTCISTSSLQDVFRTVENAFKYSIHSSFKVILTCQTSPSQTDVILIWILEKNLQIFFNGSGALKKYEVAKVLFKFVDSSESTFKLWQNDSMVSTMSVSKVMMVDLLKHLYKFNKFFPLEYSISNDFKISYMLLYD